MKASKATTQAHGHAARLNLAARDTYFPLFAI